MNATLWHNTGADVRIDTMQMPVFVPDGGMDSVVNVTCADVDFTILINWEFGSSYPTPPASIHDTCDVRITYAEMVAGGGSIDVPIPGTYPDNSAWVAVTFDNNEARVKSPILSRTFIREPSA